MKKSITSFLIFALAFAMQAQTSQEIPSASTVGTLTVKVTTAAANGGYEPSNVFAIWIQNNSGVFVKTLAAYAEKRVSDLPNWVSNSAKNKVDAVTGATLNSHATRTFTWNGTNISQVTVSDGLYTIKMELADGGNSKVTTYTINKTSSVTNGTLISSSNCFNNISVQWVPANTALNQLEDAKQYSVYPNPTRSTAYISGYDINKIELYTINGKLLFVSNNQKIDLSGLANGVYFAKLITESGNFMKKIEKL